jgi:hypothetical protein
MRAQLGNVILWTTCSLAALIIYAAVSGNVQQDMIGYWWVAAGGVGLMGVATHYLLTGDR